VKQFSPANWGKKLPGWLEQPPTRVDGSRTMVSGQQASTITGIACVQAWVMIDGECTINESEPAINHINVLLSAQYAFHCAREHVVKPDEANCQWTRSTYMIGWWEYYAATVDAKAPDLYAKSGLSVWVSF
jgi:hypothetical protein